MSDREGIYYANDERGVLWEFYLSRPFAAGGDDGGDQGEVRFHYVVNYEFERPGVFVVEWLDVDDAHADLGGRASVGMQGGELSFFFLTFYFFFQWVWILANKYRLIYSRLERCRSRFPILVHDQIDLYGFGHDV